MGGYGEGVSSLAGHCVCGAMERLSLHMLIDAVASLPHPSLSLPPTVQHWASCCSTGAVYKHSANTVMLPPKIAL